MKIVRKPKVAIRTDSGIKTGLGHLRRCLSLADFLARRGAEVDFFIFDDGVGQSLLDRSGFSYWNLDHDYDLPCLETLSDYDAVVADSYSLDTAHFKYLSDNVPVTTVIDDMGHNALPVDIVVNQNLSADGLKYKIKKDTRLLLGPQYAMLNSRFSDLRMRGSSDELRLLVMMGGSDQHRATEKALLALTRLPATFYVDVVVGGGSKNIDDIRTATLALPMISYIHIDPPDVASIMSRSSLAITTGGVTALELASLGVPSIIMTVAENQHAPAESLYQAGVAVNLGRLDLVAIDRLSALMRGLIEDHSLRADMSRAGHDMVDGLGADRVAEILLEQIAAKTGMSWVMENVAGNGEYGEAFFSAV